MSQQHPEAPDEQVLEVSQENPYPADESVEQDNDAEVDQ